MSYIVHLSPKSTNAKTGPIPVSTTEASCCPPSCPFANSGCYAKSGPLALHWRAVSSGQRGQAWRDFVAAVAAFPAGQLWRHNQAGDLPGHGEQVDGQALAELVAANAGKRGFTYTHKHQLPENFAHIKAANAAGFTVNLSANTLRHADELASLQIGPVAVVLPATQTTNTTTPEGRKVVICPATQREGVSCATCQLCSRAQRSVVVGFPAHGSGHKKASAVASNS